MSCAISADAEAMPKKADAFAHYGGRGGPPDARRGAPPGRRRGRRALLSSFDGTDRHLDTDGASPLSRQVTDNGTQGMELLCSTTEVDLAELLQGLARSRAASPRPGFSTGRRKDRERLNGS